MPGAAATESPKRKKPIRIGIIGAGNIAVNGHWPRIRDDHRVAVTAVCRRNPQLLNAAKAATGAANAYTDWRKLLDAGDVDAVIVSTPHHLHKDPVIESLQRGLDVLVEKPLALTAHDAKQMVNAAHASTGKLMVAYSRRSSPDWQLAQKMVSDGRIGAVRQISMVAFADFGVVWDANAAARTAMFGKLENPEFFHDIIKPGNWYSDADQAGGGFFVGMATHYIDTMLWLGQAAPTSVSCFSGSNSASPDGTMSAHAVLSNGVLLTITFTDGVRAKPANGFGSAASLTVIGDEGVLFTDEGGLFSDRSGLRIVVSGIEQQVTANAKDTGATQMFIDLIAADGPNPAPADDCYWTVALTEAAYLSAQQRRVIDIPQHHDA
ncbi:MAG: hypothetical protein CMJ49_09575 [Planctomycetaceae bacterium]|nr:hypothetical protein [Planctomycetaceae bacterium]